VLAEAGSLYKGTNPSGHNLSFVGVDLVDDSDPQSLLPRSDPRLKRWDETGSPPFVFTHAVQPPSIHNLASTRTSPVLLTLLLAVALFLGLGLSIGLSVSDRRRDFAVFRALGLTRRQVRTSVRVQAATMILIGLIVGIPLGIAFGRQSWKAFANQLGVANDATIPTLALVVIALIALIAAMIAAAIPAARAARIRPAVELHAQ
jgi:putative ABC transport system permease protein